MTEHASQNQLLDHLGLAVAERLDSLVVRWTSGRATMISGCRSPSLMGDSSRVRCCSSRPLCRPAGPLPSFTDRTVPESPRVPNGGGRVIRFASPDLTLTGFGQLALIVAAALLGATVEDAVETWTDQLSFLLRALGERGWQQTGSDGAAP